MRPSIFQRQRRSGRRTMKVFIVEDAVIMLGNLRSILSGIPGVTLVGHADGADAIERIGTLLPDLVVLDIGLRDGAGIDMLENIKKLHPGIKVMVLADCTDEFYFDRCKRAGADYFFDKAFQLTQAREVIWQWVHPDRLDGKPGALQSHDERDIRPESVAGFPLWPNFKVA